MWEGNSIVLVRHESKPHSLASVVTSTHTFFSQVDQPGGVNPPFAQLCTLCHALGLVRGFLLIHVHRD